MLPLPPTSTLFPYTTLFRSASFADPLNRRSSRLPETDQTAQFAEAVDRKSTRLNSSHPSISYAVFCLKKKNVSVRDIFIRKPGRKHRIMLERFAQANAGTIW